MNKKKLAIFIQDMDCGGAQKVVLNLLSNECLFNYFEIHLIVFVAKPFFFEIPQKVIIHKMNIKISNNIFVRFYLFLKKVLFTIRLNKKYKFDRIFSHLTTSNIIVLLSLIKHRYITIVEHNIPLKGLFGMILVILSKITYKKAKSIIFVSYSVKDEWLKVLDICNYRVIYNPINVNEIVIKTEKKHLQLMQTDFFLAAGRLDIQKGFDILIDAYSLIKEKKTTLLIIGNGKEYSKLKELINKHKLNDRVFIKDFTQDIHQYIKNAKAFIMPSRWEGLPMLLIEALICTKKIIAFDCPGGVSEVLKNGEFGKLIPAFNIEFLAKTMENIDSISFNYLEETLQSHLDNFEIENCIKQYIKELE